MNALLAIAFKTIRSAIRSKTVHVLLFFSAMTVFILPMTLSHDGTAKGLVQIAITYTLGITGVLLSLSAVWLGATLVAEDIEGYQIHMVVSKPVGRAQIMLGKWLGVVILLGGLLCINAVAIFGMCHYRLYRAQFDADEITRLKSEVLIGRQTFGPCPIDINAWTRAELNRRLSMGMKLPEKMTENMARDSIQEQVSRGAESIQFNTFRPCVFKGLPTGNKDGMLHLRYRIFVEKARKKDQRATEGVWLIQNPEAKGIRTMEASVPIRTMGGAFRELKLSSRFITSNGELRLKYLNLDPNRKTVVIQQSDGPMLMLGSVSFANNYIRVSALLMLQIMFMATLGCATGAALSTPMAVFIAFSYIFMGLLVRYIRVSQEGMEDAISSNILFMIFQRISHGVEACTFSLNEYVQIGALTDGRLIELGMLLSSSTAMIFFRAIPILAIGLICFDKRELGLVIRK